MDSKEWYTFKEAQEMLGIGRGAFDGMRNRGEINIIGKRVGKTEIERLLGHPIGESEKTTQILDEEEKEQQKKQRMAERQKQISKDNRDALAAEADIADVKDIQKMKASYEKLVADVTVAKEHYENGIKENEVMQEQLSRKLVDTDNLKQKIATEYKGKLAKELESAKQKHKALITPLDNALALVLNSPSDAMSPSFKKGLAEHLSELADAVGMSIETGDHNQYMRYRDREWAEVQPDKLPEDVVDAKSKHWQPPVVTTADELPENIRKAYKMVWAVYDFCVQDVTGGLGRRLCQNIRVTMHMIHQELDFKTNEHLDVEKLKGYFTKITSAIMATAEQFQNVEAQGDGLLNKNCRYEGWTDWLVEVEQKICQLVDIRG